MRKTVVFMITIISLISVAFATSNQNISIVDNSTKVYDFADLLSTSEENSLYSSINEFIQNYDLDMAIVTINQNFASAKRYADDFYDYNDFGIGSTNDGLLFLIDMDNREMYITTTGTAQLIYDDYRINRILDATYDEIADNDYYGCANEFVRLSGDYASMGMPDSNKYARIDEYGDYYVATTHNKGVSFEIVFVIAGVITLIFMLITLSKHRMVKKASEAKHYLKSIRITNRVDSFLHTHTSKVYIPPANTSSGGGSSTHHSSSGTSHGGGGRRF